jgi:hypothetical protein
MERAGCRLTYRGRMPTAQIAIEGGEYFLGWGTLTLINAALARSLGRSGLGWFLGSLFIGPIATLLLACLGPANGRRR